MHLINIHSLFSKNVNKKQQKQNITSENVLKKFFFWHLIGKKNCTQLRVHNINTGVTNPFQIHTLPSNVWTKPNKVLRSSQTQTLSPIITDCQWYPPATWALIYKDVCWCLCVCVCVCVYWSCCHSDRVKVMSWIPVISMKIILIPKLVRTMSLSILFSLHWFVQGSWIYCSIGSVGHLLVTFIWCFSLKGCVEKVRQLSCCSVTQLWSCRMLKTNNVSMTCNKTEMSKQLQKWCCLRLGWMFHHPLVQTCDRRCDCFIGAIKIQLTHSVTSALFTMLGKKKKNIIRFSRNTIK